MRKGTIENWQEVDVFGTTRIAGHVYGCGSFREGTEFITSPVIKYHTIMGQMIVETESGSMYQLGKPAEQDRTFKEIVSDHLRSSGAN